jgi:glycosyltransferase involved in cell wall biosynthesis
VKYGLESPVSRILEQVKRLNPVKKLLVINYSMDDSDPLLAHQIAAVRALASNFSTVHVITGHRGIGAIQKNVTIENLHWDKNSKIKNIVMLYRRTLPLLKKRDVVVFSHMTDVQCAFIAPATKILGIKHYLWYAHKTYSMYLRWSKFWVDGIITSTRGSCPIQSDGVYLIGQALDPDELNFTPKSPNEFKKGVHIGRFDSSKNVHLIAETCNAIQLERQNLTFTQIGDPSNANALKYANEFQVRFKKEIEIQRFSILPSISRFDLASTLSLFDFFIHAYQGSLDKTLVEATLIGLPVITINAEYHREFGTWSGKINPSLLEEYLAAASSSPANLFNELEKRRKIAVDNHSIINWKKKLLNILLYP